MGKEVKIVVKGVRRQEPDLRKLARALIELVRAEDEGLLVKPEPPKEEAE